MRSSFIFPECWSLTCVKARIYVRHCARCRAKWLNYFCNIACNDVNWTWILQPIKLHLEESRTSHAFMSSFMSWKVFCGTTKQLWMFAWRKNTITSAKVSIAVSSNCVCFLDIIFAVVIVAFVVVVLILNTRGGAHVARKVLYFFLLPFDSKFPFHFTCCALLITLSCFEGTNLMRNYYVKCCNLLPARRIKHVARRF